MNNKQTMNDDRSIQRMAAITAIISMPLAVYLMTK